MNEKKIKVNLHAHSTMSDGGLTPEALALRFVRRGLAYASLTDHDTTAGSLIFRETLSRKGAGCIDGIELTVSTRLGTAHLLAYGLDILNPELLEMLPPMPVSGPRTAGIPPVTDCLDLIHSCGGAAFLAHPLHLSRDIDALDSLCAELAPLGLDGIEALYAGYGESDTASLRNLAARYNLAVSCGGDFHADGIDGQADSMEMAESDWVSFRNALFARSSARTAALPGKKSAGAAKRVSLPGKLVLRTVVPALTALALFSASFFLIIIPRDEALILERKKETIRELTESAVSILAEYDMLFQKGGLSLEQAKIEAVERLRDLRYGRLNKDYFWITDMVPRMILHPYRTDLEGDDLTGFRDGEGQAVFVEFVRAVSLKEEGYVEYLWQWEDDMNRIVPKLSFVRRFAPWDWVIGTGIYLDDVEEEIALLTRDLIWLCLGITALLSLLITAMVRQSLAIERGKISAETALHESTERYRALADGATDGTVIVMNGACTFANGAFLAMTGYSEKEIQLLRITELLEGWDYSSGNGALTGGVHRLAKRSGESVEVRISAMPIALAAHEGMVLSVKETGLTEAVFASGPLPDADRERRIGNLVSRLETDSLWLSGPASEIARETAYCSMDTPPGGVARGMRDSPSRTVIVRDGTLAAVGIITAADLAFRRPVPDDVQKPLSAASVMTSPVISVAVSAPVAEALAVMRKYAVDRVALRARDGSVGGVLLASDIAGLHSDSLSLLAREAAAASSVSSLADIAFRAKEILGPLARSGARARFVLRGYASVHDAIAEAIVALVLKQLGEPPAEWVFIAFGSMGREEFLPGSDQDNALVWRHGDGDPEKERSFFMRFGELLCSGLEKTGIPLCPGNVMASNPLWNAPLHEWESRLARSIREPEPERMLDLEIFFDFRRVAGSGTLSEDLKLKAETMIPGEPGFLVHLAHAVRRRKTPGGNPRSLSAANLKELSACFSGFTRVYALRDSVHQTNTFDRLDALSDSGSLNRDTRERLTDAFDAVLTIRLIRALGGRSEGRLLDAALLSFAIEQVSLLQKKIGFDFLGSAI